jgi:hypothetical protein
VRSFFEWLDSSGLETETWVILGKGPTFAQRNDFDLSRFRLMSLNHAVREQPVDVAHLIDTDVVSACASSLEQNARVLVMPWFPHVHNVVGTRTLLDLAAELPVLRQLDQAGRLLWYDLSTSPVRHGSAPVVEATYFSAEAALNLLAEAGVRSVRSLGIDGGASYSSAFDDLRDTTLLANGRSSFDLQFEGFARTIVRTGIDFSPLDRPAPARVLSAYTPDEALAVAVLHHSVRRRASLTVQTTAIPDGAGIPIDPGQTVVITPRAQVMADLRRLWSTKMMDLDLMVPAAGAAQEKAAVALAGAGLHQQLPRIASAVRAGLPMKRLPEPGLLTALPLLSPEWSPGWSGGWVLTYPADGLEPWLSRSHPFGHLWARDLLHAIAHGYLPPATVAEQVALGYARPSLLYQVEQGLDEPLLLPPKARRLDRDFLPARRPPNLLRTHWRPVLNALGRRLGRWSREFRAGEAAPR